MTQEEMKRTPLREDAFKESLQTELPEGKKAMEEKEPGTSARESILRVQDLVLTIHKGTQDYTAVDGISYEVRRGEILGIVGESGCGKTITNLAVMNLLADEISVTSGSIWYDGEELTAMNEEQRSALAGNTLAMIYQEPLTSLNPLIRIGSQIEEPLRIHHPELSKEERRKRVLQAMTEVGLQEPEKLVKCYPHQLSGGMRQRVCIAMAVICRPKLLIADEPTTALDVTVQARVLRLLKHINRKYGMSIVFISHDLAVVRQLCDRVAVMYAGKIVEEGAVETILHEPAHEYTKGLIRSIPQISSKGSMLPTIPGRVPAVEMYHTPCPFADRCGKAQDICRKEPAPRKELGQGHVAYCHVL